MAMLKVRMQLEEKGHSIFKSSRFVTTRAAVGPLFGSLGARLSAPTDFVAQAVVNKAKGRTTLSSTMHLAVNADSHAELAIISWMNH